MKSIIPLVAAISAFVVFGASAQEAAVRKANAVIFRKNAPRDAGAQLPGWISDSGPDWIAFGQQSGQPKKIAKSTLDDIQLETINASRQAQALYAAGSLEEAASLYGQIADYYPGVAFISGNFATEARFMQIECLRKLGKLDQIAPLLATRTGQTITSQLPASFQKQNALNRLWVQYAAGDFAALEKTITRFQVPQTGSAALLPVPNFIKLESSLLSQIAFLRGSVFLNQGEKAKAVEDFYAAATIGNGDNRWVAGEALKKAVAIQGENPALEKSKEALWNVQSAAYAQMSLYSGGVPAPEIEKFAVRPDRPKAQFAPKSTPVKEEATPAEEKKPAAKAEQPKGQKAAKKKPAEKK